jgi:hypothetical protein
MLSQTVPNDIFRRFTPTPLNLDFGMMGRSFRLETNSPNVVSHVRNVSKRYDRVERGRVDFLWRIVSDPGSGLCPPLSRRTAFSDGGLRFVNFNQRSFLAVDLDAHEGMAFLSPELCEDEMGFYSPVLSDLFDLSSAMIGLTEIMAGCVAIDGRGLLVFGSPRSGKTTACYWAAKMGLEFHGDQVTCVELVSGRPRAWGQFWPVAFRPETLEFLPEIEDIGRPFRYRDLNLLCFDHRIFLPAQASSVTPVGCVFLDRCATGSTQLRRIEKDELSGLLSCSLPFIENRRFEYQRGAVVRSLAELPAYHLAYGADPRAAAELFPRLLKEDFE